MANPSGLMSWALSRADALDLHATNYTWTGDWLPGVFDYSIELTVEGVTCYGRGLATTEDLALTKATAEALERVVYRLATDLPNTSGLAVHDTEDKAFEAARLELLERDAFFCHYLTATPFQPAGPLTNTGQLDIGSLQERLQARGANLYLGKMRAGTAVHAFACGVSGRAAARPFGLRVGLGCSKSRDQAIEQAVLEALRGMTSLVEGEDRGRRLTRNEFDQLSEYRPLDHDALGLDLEACRWTERLFPDSPDHGLPSNILVAQDHSLTIVSRRIELPTAIKDAPVVAAYAESPRLQRAFFGPVRDRHLNFDRLIEFAGSGWDRSQVVFEPHVLG